MPSEDILSKLNRLLAITPEHAFAAPPISRRTLADAATEIALLRKRVAELEAVGNDLVAIAAANGKAQAA